MQPVSPRSQLIGRTDALLQRASYLKLENVNFDDQISPIKSDFIALKREAEPLFARSKDLADAVERVKKYINTKTLNRELLLFEDDLSRMQRTRNIEDLPEVAEDLDTFHTRHSAILTDAQKAKIGKLRKLAEELIPPKPQIDEESQKWLKPLQGRLQSLTPKKRQETIQRITEFLPPRIKAPAELRLSVPKEGIECLDDLIIGFNHDARLTDGMRLNCLLDVASFMRNLRNNALIYSMHGLTIPITNESESLFQAYASLADIHHTLFSRVSICDLSRYPLQPSQLYLFLRLLRYEREVEIRTLCPSMPRELGQCRNLRYLSIDAANLPMLPESIKELRYLETLELRCQSIKQWPKELGRLFLKTLLLSSPTPERIPEEVGEINTLETCTIFGDNIQALPKSLYKLERLKHLMLMCPKLEITKDNFLWLKQLPHALVQYMLPHGGFLTSHTILSRITPAHPGPTKSLPPPSLPPPLEEDPDAPTNLSRCSKEALALLSTTLRECKLLQTRLTNESSYQQVLGVGRNASTQDVKTAYRALSLLLHPDKTKGNPLASEAFIVVNEAYQTLSGDSHN